MPNPIKGLHEFSIELRKWWSFDDRQQHTHSWHSREDFIAKRLPELLADSLAAKDKLLVEAREALEPFTGMRLARPENDDVIAWLGAREDRPILNADIKRARTTLANLKAGMEK